MRKSNKVFSMTRLEFVERFGVGEHDLKEKQIILALKKKDTIVVVHMERPRDNILRLFKTNSKAADVDWISLSQGWYDCCDTRFEYLEFLQHRRDCHDSDSVEFFLFHPEIFDDDNYLQQPTRSPRDIRRRVS